MKQILAGILIALPLTLASAPVFAGGGQHSSYYGYPSSGGYYNFFGIWCPSSDPTPTPTSVPEIDASAGALALAALAALMLLAWERRRAASV